MGDGLWAGKGVHDEINTSIPLLLPWEGRVWRYGARCKRGFKASTALWLKAQPHCLNSALNWATDDGATEPAKMPGKGKKTEGEAPRGRSLADAVSEALDEKLRATAAKGELQVAGGTVESGSGGAPLSDGVSPPTPPAATLTLGRTEPELLVEELMARMEEQASRAAAERLELEALLSAAQAASAKAEAAQSRTEMTEHERAVHALRVDFARQLEDLRSELKRMSADGASTTTSSGEGVEFFTIPEATSMAWRLETQRHRASLRPSVRSWWCTGWPR